MKTLSLRMAARSLGRNPRRTILSIVGLAVGVVMALLVQASIAGQGELIVRSAAEGGVGHFRIAPEGWLERREPELRLADPDATLAAVRAVDGVKVAVPRTRAEGLLAMGTRSSGVEITGVDASGEPEANRIARVVERGRWLREGERGTAVIGSELASRLDVDVDDDVMATAAAAGGQMESAMLRVVGIIHTGSELDSFLCFVPVEDAAALGGRPGVGEISILVEEHERIEEVGRSLASVVRTPNDVLRWEDLVPDVATDLELHRGTSSIINLIVLVVAFFGIASAQLTAALERRKEFAVLLALGTRVWTVISQLVLEGAVLGVAGAAVALAIGLPILWLFHSVGWNITGIYGQGEEFAFGGVLFEPVLYGAFGWWIVKRALFLSLVATVLAMLYPAWFAARTNPADALRVAQ